MKRTKKLLAFLMAAIMMLTIGSAAFAAGEKKLTVSNETSGYTYTAYQIFDGDLSTDGKTLSNVEWGPGISAAGKTALYNRYNLTGTNQTAAKVAEKIGENNTAAEADAIAALLATNGLAGSGTPLAYNSTAKNYSADVDPGWWLVTNTGVPTGQHAHSDYIVQVVGDVTVDPKSDVPTSEKKVDDVNDSTGAQQKLNDSADYDIGDSVPYTLTATLPAADSYADYTKYYIQFQDVMCEGLTWDGSARIYFGASDTTGTAITFTKESSLPSDKATAYAGGSYWTYTIADLKTTASSLTGGDTITIKYSAVLNEKAKIGSAGNPNEYRIKFSNNPNDSGSGTPPTGDTPWDKNIVFTYKTVFNKVDSTNKSLEGADFKLEKKVNGSWVDVTQLHTGTDAKNPTKTVTGNKFEFAGLDDGEYKLTETVTPTGFNTIDPIEFTITASHDLKSDDPRLTELTGTDGAEFTMTPDLTAGSLTANVINNKGSELPSTGGMGTTLIYIIGAILVVGAGVVLITKKRMTDR